MRSLFGLCFGVGWFVILSATGTAFADETLHARIDQLIEAAAGTSVAPDADDAEFLRRVYLDFVGRVPSVDEARAFLSDSAAEKRVALIDRLLASSEFPRDRKSTRLNSSHG